MDEKGGDGGCEISGVERDMGRGSKEQRAWKIRSCVDRDDDQISNGKRLTYGASQP